MSFFPNDSITAEHEAGKNVYTSLISKVKLSCNMLVSLMTETYCYDKPDFYSPLWLFLFLYLVYFTFLFIDFFYYIVHVHVAGGYISMNEETLCLLYFY